MGGITKAIESGLPKRRIEEASAKKQAAIDTGNDIIIGINKYRTEDKTKDNSTPVCDARSLCKYVY